MAAVSARIAWACEFKRSKCRNPYGCHCKEIQALHEQIAARPKQVGHRYRDVPVYADSFLDDNLASVGFMLEVNRDGSWTNAVHLLVRPRDIRCDESGEHPGEEFAAVTITYEELRAMVKVLDDDWARQQKHAPVPEGLPGFAGETAP